MQAATPCAASVLRRRGGKASIYKCGRIALHSPITRMSRRPNVHYGSLADIEVCIINVCFALLKQTFFNTVFMSAKCQSRTLRLSLDSLGAGSEPLFQEESQHFA